MRIPLNEPYLISKSLNYLKECLKINWISTGGPLVDKFEKKLCKLTGSKNAIACNSGTAALHISIKLLNPRPGDEIIVPTLTFVATINSVIYNSCKPIFMDSDNFYNIDIKKTIEFLQRNTFKKGSYTFNKKTKKKIIAIIVTHVWGNAVNLKKLITVCKNKNIQIIEDASESIGTRYKKSNKHTGTLGLIGVISFNANKLITTGGGGVIITDNNKLAERARYLTTQAKEKSIYFVHNEIGYNYRMTNISAAIGLSQIDNFNYLLNKKKEIRKLYEKQIKNSNTFKLNPAPDYANNKYWMNVVQFKKKNNKGLNKVFFKFKKKNIEVRPVWKLNHTQRKFKKYERFKLSNSLKLVSNSICIPSSASMKSKEIKLVSKVLNG